MTSAPVTQRSRCAGCESTELRPALDLGSAPLADEFPREPAPDQERHPLRMAICGKCGLGQLLDVVPDALLWGGDYAFRTGSSATLREYFDKYAAWLRSNYGLLLRHGLMVEIGCNDGTLMRALRDQLRARGGASASILGVDAASGPVREAQDADLDVMRGVFGLDVAREIVAQRGQANVIVANNVLAHAADLNDFMAGARELLDPHGVAIIEVQYLPDLLLGNDFALLYHEHRAYFPLLALATIARQWGLEPRDAWMSDAQGGSLRVELRHASAPGQRASVVSEVIWSERWLLSDAAMDGLQPRADRLRSRLLDMVRAERAAGRVVAGYGASAKASTLLAWTGLGRAAPEWGAGVARGTADNPISWVVDTTPGKVGRFMPGTAIPVLARQDDLGFAPHEREPDNPDTYLLMIYNYLGHVLRKEYEWLAAPARHRRMIVPLPIPRMI